MTKSPLSEEQRNAQVLTASLLAYATVQSADMRSIDREVLAVCMIGQALRLLRERYPPEKATAMASLALQISAAVDYSVDEVDAAIAKALKS